MRVYACLWVYMRVYAGISVYMHVYACCVYACICVYMCVCLYMRVYACMRVCACICVFMCVYAYMRVDACIWVYMRGYACIMASPGTPNERRWAPSSRHVKTLGKMPKRRFWQNAHPHHQDPRQDAFNPLGPELQKNFCG